VRWDAMERILVVDDNAASRDLLRAVLETPDRTVLEAANGREAVERILEHAPDLVLLDIELPFLDGFGVLREIRSDPRFARLPVLAVTANAMQGVREKVLDAGFDGYVVKPIRASAVRKQVTELLESVRRQA
jgi:CheY-like chemotaxis protein